MYNGRLISVCMCGALALVACSPDQESDSEGGVMTQAQSLAESAPLTGATGAGDVGNILKKKGTPLPVLEVMKPDMEAVKAHKSIKVPEGLPASQVEKLQGSPMPVMLPSILSASQLSVAQATTGKHWYAVSMKDEGLTVYVQGTRTQVEHAQLELSKEGDELTKQPFILSRTHAIVTLSFERFGLSYHMDIECARPLEDSRCTEDDYARSLYDSFAVVSNDTGIMGGVQ